MQYFLQMLMMFPTGIGFSILLNVRGYRLFLNAAGAMVTYGIYLCFFLLWKNEFAAYLAASALTGFLCEGLARLTHTPTTLMLVPMITPPLMPGGDLYTSFSHMIAGDMRLAYDYGILLIIKIAAINIGILFSGTVVKLWYYLRQQRCIFQ